MDQELPLDSNTFRRLMARFATGVAVLAVTSPDEGVVSGMTANAIASVSLDPYLLLVCVDRNANIVQAVLNADSFSLSLLRDEQLSLSDYFAGRWQGEPPEFEFYAGELAPVLKGAIGVIQCRRSNVLEGGDHWIVLGEVAAINLETPPPSPLIFFGSQYHNLTG